MPPSAGRTWALVRVVLWLRVLAKEALAPSVAARRPVESRP
jgi:hypothetical protein